MATKYSKRKHKVEDPATKQWSERLRINVILVLLAVYTALLFGRSINFQFVNWDDNSYITGNLLIRDFSFKGLLDIFSTPVIGMYNPLVFVIYAFEYHFWGMDPMVFHLFNVIFHILASIACFKFIYELTKRYETAAIVALFFAIHPMHVSIATWVSELKTSVYVIFYFFALVSYIRYVRNNYQSKYLIITGGFFILSLLSKPSAVTLAPMLLLIDYYLSRKFDRRVILEKLPFFALSLFFGVLTILTHVAAEDSIFEAANDYSLINNILVSNYSIVFYLNKFVYPVALSTIYPYPENLMFLPFKYYFSILVIPFVLWLVYRSGKFKKEMIFGLLYFVIAISVMLRIVPSGFFRASNVYSYMSYTGLFFIVAQYFTYIIDGKFSYAQRVKGFVFIGLILLAAFYTWQTTKRVSVWENSITLFSDVIKKKPKLALAYNNRGISKIDIGDLSGAIEDLTKSIELDPYYPIAYNNRGKIYVDRKEYDLALKDLNMALQLDSDYAEAYINRGNVYYHYEKFEEAFSDYNKAIKCNPNIEVAYKNRSKIKAFKKDMAGCLKDLDKAIALNPDYVDAYIDKGNVLFQIGKYSEALKTYDQAIRLDPNRADAYNNKAFVERAMNDTLNAARDLQRAIEIKEGRAVTLSPK